MVKFKFKQSNMQKTIPSYDADLLATRNAKGKAFQYKWKSRSVAHEDFVKLYCALRGPFRGRFPVGDFVWGFLINLFPVTVVNHSFHGLHVVL